MNGFFRTSVAILLVTLVGACQTTPTMDIEEAKAISTELSSSSFVIPPRGIDDILEFVNGLASNDKVAGEDLEMVRASRPKTDNSIELTKFYVKQAQAAGKLGRIDVLLPALRNAAKHAKNARGIFGVSALHESNILYELSTTESHVGNIGRGLEIMEQALALVEGDSSWSGRNMQLSRLDELGRIYANLGDIGKAEEYSAEARSIGNEKATNVHTGEETLYWKEAYYPHRPNPSQVATLRAKGKTEEAEAIIRSEIRDYMRFERGRKSIDLFNARNSLASILQSQGRLIEAETYARQALFSSGLSGSPTSTISFIGSALTRLASIFNDSTRYGDAEKLAKATIAMYARAGVPKSSLNLAAAYQEIAISQVMRGDWKQAMQIADQLFDWAKVSVDTFRKMTQNNVNYRVLLIQNGRYEQALSDLKEMTVRFVGIYGDDHPKTMELVGLMGFVEYQRKNIETALAHFEKAIPVLAKEAVQRQTEAGGRAVRDMRRVLILDAYLATLGNLETEGRQIDVADESFVAAQIAGTKSVQNAIADNTIRDQVKDPVLSETIRSEQDLSRQIQALHASINLLLTDKTGSERLPALQEKLGKLSAARTLLGAEIERSLPPEFKTLSSEPLTIAEAQAALRFDEALVAVYSTSDNTYVWAIPSSGDPVFKSSDLSSNELADLVARLRVSLAPTILSLGDIPPFDVDAAHEIYRRILSPVEKGWKNARNLLFVTQGPLASLPISLLSTKSISLAPERGGLFMRYRDVAWLARSHAVSVLPSVASLRSFNRAMVAKASQKPFVGFGDPFFSPAQATEAKQSEKTQIQVASRGFQLRSRPRTRTVSDAEIERLPRLPDTRQEILEVASALKADTADVYLGQRASETLVKSLDLTPYRIISFATHGLVPGDLNGLDQPALALSSPEVTGEDNDGLLTMGEIMGLKLNADWAILSACNTAAAEGEGTEAVSGLGKAFFYAGAKALLVSNWPVHSGATTTLMIELFRRQAGDVSLKRNEALRQTRVQLIDELGFEIDGKLAFSYAHPIFWAPFTLVGDGGGARAATN